MVRCSYCSYIKGSESVSVFFYHEGTEVQITSYNYQIPVWVFIVPMTYLTWGIIIKKSFIWFRVLGVREHVTKVDQHRFGVFCYSNPRGWRQLAIVTASLFGKVRCDKHSPFKKMTSSVKYHHLQPELPSLGNRHFLLQHGAAASPNMPFPACLRCEP